MKPLSIPDLPALPPVETTPRSLAEVSAQLDKLGIPFSTVELMDEDDKPRDDFALHCELKAFGNTNGIAYFVSAATVFTPQGATRPDVDEVFKSFRRLQSSLLDDAPRQPLYLFIVGKVGPEYRHTISSIEQDQYLAKKSVVTLEQLQHWLTNPFLLPAGVDRANTEPKVKVVGNCNEQTGAAIDFAALGATDVFRPRDILETQSWSEFCGENGAQLRMRAEAVVLRTLGGDYSLSWEDDGEPILDRGGYKQPLAFISNGEQIVVTYAVFLARVSRQVRPGMSLGIYGQLNGLDFIRLIGALDCLRDFVLATGASVSLQLADSGKQAFARHKFEPVMKALGYWARSN